MNQARTDNCEGLSPGKCPAGKQRGPGRHQNTATKRWIIGDNNATISCYLKTTKESKRGYKKRMYNAWNEVGMTEMEKQHYASQVRSNFKNKRN